jgi:hypothetical protein
MTVPPLKHAALGASNAHRWLHCGGSVKAEQGIPDRGSSFAAEGTAAHELSELVLASEDNHDPHQWIGKELPESGWYVDKEMADYVQVYTDYCRAIAAKADETFLEQRVSYADWVPNGFGTNDFGALFVEEKRIKIADLKYGKGVQVDADENPQAMLYALGTYAEYSWVSDFDWIDIAIVQPRLDHISEWSISVKDLLKWAEWVTQRAEIALSDDAERVPGEKQCRFCKAKDRCPALLKYAEDIIMADFDELEELESPDRLTDNQLSNILQHKGLIESWLTSVETVVRERLEAGGDFPGFKIVEGRSLRKWSDEEYAHTLLHKYLGDNLYKKSMISPAQAEKLMIKENRHILKDVVVKPAGRPTLVPESDKRQPINLRDDDFDVVD